MTSKSTLIGGHVMEQKNIQISTELMRDMITLISALEGIPLDNEVTALRNRIQAQIYAKFDAMKRRDAWQAQRQRIATEHMLNKN